MVLKFFAHGSVFFFSHWNQLKAKAFAFFASANRQMSRERQVETFMRYVSTTWLSTTMMLLLRCFWRIAKLQNELKACLEIEVEVLISTWGLRAVDPLPKFHDFSLFKSCKWNFMSTYVITIGHKKSRAWHGRWGWNLVRLLSFSGENYAKFIKIFSCASRRSWSWIKIFREFLIISFCYLMRRWFLACHRSRTAGIYALYICLLKEKGLRNGCSQCVGQLYETLINDPTMILPKSGVNDIIKLSYENWVRYDSIMWTISALPLRSPTRYLHKFSQAT